MSEVPKKQELERKRKKDRPNSDFQAKPNIESSREDGPARMTRVMAMSFEGPLPPPHILEAYNHIVPNGAERIFAVFEKQVDHRHQLERTVVGTNSNLQIRGFYAALLIAVGTIASGVWLAYLGKSVVGISAIIGALASLIATFIYGKSKQSGERAQKKGSMQSQR